ncbi:hypothetical protein MMC12_001850 [Toensbergia leucococca]|nr:hypothetical protein [Toensbergia leucococca]
MSPSRVETSSRVLIAGGGLGGLALAQGLKKESLPFHVFEQDPTPDFRAQGYRLKINGEGALALKKVLSPDLWTLFEETCAESESGETNFNAIDASITASRAGPGTRGGMKIYTADRTVLRNILLTGLRDDISYGKQLVKYTTTEDAVVVTFKDGSTEEGKLLVGADGVRSPVRKQYLPNHRPVDTNGSCIYGKTPLTTELTERFPERAAKWMTLILDKTPMTQTLDIDETPLTLLLEPIRFKESEHRRKLPVDYIYWVLISRTDVFGASSKELLRLSGSESAKLSLKLTEEWDPSIRALLELQDISQSSTLRVGSAIPEIVPWEASERVTLLGDSIHVMSPCGGVGAVTALCDAALLSGILGNDGISATSIGKYEKEMRTYAQKAIERSYFGGRKIFGQRPFAECKVLEW